MRRLPPIALAFLLCGACAAHAPVPSATSAAAEPPAVERPLDRVVIVSVDGLRPSDCARLPVLGALAADGAFAAPPDGVLSVLPSVTYPSHTTMVTGVLPARHGITTNLAPDPSVDGKNDGGWRWYREDIEVPTLYDLAFDAGLRTVLVWWPVTVGARATALMPEFWRARTDDDAKLVRALSTPGLFEQVDQRFTGFATDFVPRKKTDAMVMDAAIALLEGVEPHLLLVHLTAVDAVQHAHGPDSPEAEPVLQEADAQVTRLLKALERSPSWPRTVLVVLSDHGFLPIHKRVALKLHLAQRGLGDRVWTITSGGLAYLYLSSETDQEAAAQARALLEELAQDPASGIGIVLDQAAIHERGGDPRAFLAVEPTVGFMLSSTTTGELLADSKGKGAHGYLPERPEMRASLLFYGPKIEKSTLHGARLVDVAPTIAPWLGLAMSGTDGAPLPVRLVDADR